MRGRMSQWNPRIAAVFLMAVLVTLLHWTTPHAGKVSEVRIGNILPLTGPSASAGRQNRSAIELATEYVNAAGGIKSLGGARLVNAWADTRGEVAFGMSAVEHLIKNEKVSVISGAWNSAVTYPTTQAAEQAKIPYVVPVSVRDTITDRGFKYVFRTAPKDGWRSRDQFRFLRDMTRSTRTKVETLALVFENGGWGTSMKDQWTKLATSQGYRVVLVEPYDDAATDLTVTVMKIRNAQPDVILLASFTEDAVLLASAMSTLKVGAKAVIASGGGHGGNAFLESAGKSCEYLFDVSGWEPDMDRPAIAPSTRSSGSGSASSSPPRPPTPSRRSMSLPVPWRRPSPRNRKTFGTSSRTSRCAGARAGSARTSWPATASSSTGRGRTGMQDMSWSSSGRSAGPWSG